jgi:hypothetical protein
MAHPHKNWSYQSRKFDCLPILSIPFSYPKLKKIQKRLAAPTGGVLPL